MPVLEKYQYTVIATQNMTIVDVTTMIIKGAI